MAGKKNRKQKLAARSAKRTNNLILRRAKPNTPKIAQLLEQALSYHRQQNLSEAANCYRTILASEPTHADALHLIGLTYGQSHQHREAIEFYNQAIEQNPTIGAVHNNKGISLNSLEKYTQAIESFQLALKINPKDASAHSNLGHAYSKQGNHHNAIKHLTTATQLSPHHANTIYNLGNALKKAHQDDAAVQCFKKALALNPNHVGALNNLGLIYKTNKNFPDATHSFQKVLEINPQHSNALGQLSICLRQVCDWKNFDQTKKQLSESLHSGDTAPTPLASLMWFDDPQKQLACARAATKEVIKNIPPPITTQPASHDTKIKIAYLSSDFCEHPVAYLTAELYELHNREQFEISAISYGPADSGPMRQRLVNAFDHFYDASEMNDTEVALLIASKGIHIAIDLNGHTLGARLAVLAMRPAPIQLNYLGYIGTMGAKFIDYVIVDEFVAPVDQQPFFDEQLLHLTCYMVVDTQRKLPSQVPTRLEHNLPEKGFVFCCFNNSYKITPEIFSCWMQCLRNVPDSVLWLVDDNEWARHNLRNEAKARGVDPMRLIFAQRTDYSAHLARQQLADLFLDTSPYNAGTTAADALWAGLPILTCTGKSFVARMGSGLIQAAGMPELITDSLEEYQSTAIKLAKDPELLTKLKEKLIASRTTSPLFDSQKFCVNFEKNLTKIWHHWRDTLNN